MFSKRVLNFFSNRFSRLFLVYLTICFMVFSNPAYAGIVIDDAVTANVNVGGRLDFDDTPNDTSDGQTPDGAVIIIQNSAGDLTINVGDNYIDAGNTNGAEQTPISSVNDFMADGDITRFNQADRIAILDATNNNVTIQNTSSGIDGINGNVVLFGGNNRIEITDLGDIIGSVDTGDGNDVIVLDDVGWIHQYVNLRGGNNTINISDRAFIDSNVTTEDGDDTFNLAGTSRTLSYIAGNITMGNGTNTVNVSGVFQIRGALTGGTGVDTIMLSDEASITGNVTLGDGDDVLIVSGADSDDADDTDVGGTTTVNEATAGAYITGNVNLGDGNNTVTVGLESVIGGTITGGANTDTITFNDDSILSGSILTAGGNDSVTFNAGTTLSGSLDLGAGDDTATFNNAMAIAGNIDLQEGTDSITFNNTDVNGNLTGGTDATDTVNFNNSDFTQGGGGDALDLETGINILNLNNSNFAAGTTVTLNGATAGHNQTLSLTNGSTFNSTLNLTLGAGSTGTITINNSTMTLGATLAPGNGILKINVTNGGTLNLGANNITGGTDADMLTLESGGALTAGLVNLGAGNNMVTITGTSALTGNLQTGTGENTFTFGGTGTKVSGTITTAGTDNIVVFNSVTDGNTNLNKFTDTTIKSLSISNGGTITGGNFTFATGEDLVFNLSNSANFQRNVILTNGNSSDVDIIGGSTFMANLTGSANIDNVFIENSTFTGNVDLAGGNDIFNISGSTLTGNVELGAGTNTLTATNSNITGTIDATGGVVDTATFTGGTIGGNVTLGGAGITFSSTGTTFNNNINLGATTGNNTINLTNTNITGTLTLGNDGGGGDTLTLNNTTIGGATDAQGGTDTLILSGSGTISSAFNDFEILTLNGSSWTLDSNLTLNAGGVVNINTGSLTVANTRTLNTGGSNVNVAAGSSLTLIGDVNAGAGATDIDGSLTLNGGTLTSTGGVTIDGSLLGNGTIAGASPVTVNGTIGSSTAGDTINIANNLTLNDGSQINVGLSGATSNTITVTGNVVDNGTTSVNVNFNTILTDGQTYNIVTAAGGIDGTYTAPDSSFVYDFAVAPNVGNTALVLTASRTPFGELNSQNSIALRPMLTQLEIVRQANPNSQEFLALEQLSQQEFDQALLTINPSAVNNLANIANTNSNVLNNAINSRLDSMQFSLAGLPVFTGPEGPDSQQDEYGYRLWTDVNYRTGEQDGDGLALGYDFSNYNFTIGADVEFNNWLIGAAGTYATTDVSYDESGGDTEAESFNLGLYAKYFNDAFFWDNYLTVSFSDISNDRQVNVAGTNSIDSSSDAFIYRLGTQVGYKFESDSFFFTPVGGFSFGQSSIDGISESGSVFAVQTDDQDYMSLQHKLGFRTGFYNVMEGEDIYTVEFRAFWYHEYLDTDRDINARFAGGGSEFEVTGVEQDTDVFVLGLGVMFDVGNTQLRFDYDYEMSSSFKAHKLSLNWVMKF